MRKLALLLTLGLFLSATAANACDGGKTAKAHKGHKMTCNDPSCMKDGKCTMTKAEMKKSGCCTAAGKATASKAGKADCDMKDMKSAASGNHACCHPKTGDKS